MISVMSSVKTFTEPMLLGSLGGLRDGAGKSLFPTEAIFNSRISFGISASFTDRSKHATLVASTADTVKFSTKPKTVDVRLFEQ